MSDTTITVEGYAEQRQPAERGTAQLAIGFDGAERDEVVRRTTRLHGDVADEAQALQRDGVVERWAADRLQVWSDRPWSPDGTVLPLVHHASASLQVEFADPGRLGEWVERIAATEGVGVTGVEWALTAATRSRITAEVQQRSVEDAVARANAYATSLGFASVRPIAVADPGLLGSDPAWSGAAEAARVAPMARSLSKSPESGRLDLQPDDLTVWARVHARFLAS